MKSYYLIFLALIMIFLTYFKKKNKIQQIINEPILPTNNKEFVVKKYNTSKYKLDNPRYHFQEEYIKRKTFKINYSYYPYLQISPKLSYKNNAIRIYNSTGMLNITKFEYYYFKNESDIDFLNFNHIHLSMGFDQDYCNLALISIASILNSSSSDTYIHFHILGLNFGFNEIKQIIELRKINNKVEFIFYNARQIEYDFELGQFEQRKSGNYARILSPQIINNTNKVLFLDSGDIIAQKDLSEIYFYELDDNYFGWTLEFCAGNSNKYNYKFKTNNFYPQGGILLVNIRKFRQDDLYKKAVFVSKSYDSFENPCQDILITIANYKFVFFPFNFNAFLFYETDDDIIIRRNISSIQKWMELQRFSRQKYTFDEIVDSMTDPVINHFYGWKIQIQEKCNKQLIQWLKYANLTGKYEILKSKYPKPFTCEKKVQLN